MLKVKLITENDSLKGFRYFWMKKVVGFNNQVHCARCLKGGYEKQVSNHLPGNVEIELSRYNEGDLIYICGVSSLYRWEKNFHLAGRVGNGNVRVTLYTGDVLEVQGIEEISISDEAAKRLYPDRTDEFLTCRNFQFGVQMFETKV